jgi:NAD+ synthase (glutamine-hydrolysing)
MDTQGFVRVAACSLPVRIGRPADNARAILEALARSKAESCDVVVFPELCMTGYTCGDLFGDRTLIAWAAEETARLAEASASVFGGLFVVGLPIASGNALYNAAAVIAGGEILALVPKQHIPNYKEFYERRWFTPAPANLFASVNVGSAVDVPIAARAIFTGRTSAGAATGAVIGVEICEDLWVPIPPSSHLALAGANVLLNLSASNDITTKVDYRRELVRGQSARTMSAYVYASAGVTESTTDLVFGGHCLLAENGGILVESERFQRTATFISADVDVERLMSDRRRITTFHDADERDVADFDFVQELEPARGRLRRSIAPTPFVPSAGDRLAERCREIFAIQVAGLATRLQAVQSRSWNIGVSGGLDSTLALVVAAKTADLLGEPRTIIHGLTMPGFGTSDRTRTNADALLTHMGVTAEAIDIRPLCLDTFRAIRHRPFGIDPAKLSLDEFVEQLQRRPHADQGDLVFENVQARIRTMLLMSRGFVIGTGDLSELALGWATYNADHMSMYNPNVSVPKTLVRFLVRWAADHEITGPTRDVLHAIADTVISPELLPIAADGQVQSTEGTIGPYILHDFFLYHMLRFGMKPSKIFRLACQADFDPPFEPATIRRWMEVFYTRFLKQQFKRSCLPDGPKVGSVSLSPRGDWRMPSDADAALWLADLASVD